MRLTYCELAQNLNLRREATAAAKPKPPARHAVIGKSIARRDLPAKVSGGAAFVQDMRLPGMVFGRVVRPPSYRAQLVSVDEAAVKAALKYPWSNGPVEGHVNRLKTLKRQMYGRANFDLLRRRVLRSAS